MTFTNITKSTDPQLDFWELNPQIQYISPFNKLKEKFKRNSSQHMWAIFFMCDPDEEVNRFYRYDLGKRKENINNYYSNIKWDDPLFEECLEAYPFECLNAIQRALKSQIDSLKQRNKVLTKTKYTLDYTDEQTGKIVKGTASQLDAMHIKTEKIYDQLEKTLAKFQKQKDDDTRVYGGRMESASEQGLLTILIMLCAIF